MFPLFWTALLPRYRVLIHLATAAGFVWWKLPLSAPWIEAWNSWAPFPIGRTEDLTDLVALCAAGVSYWFSSAPRRQVPVPALRWAIIPLALFAFGATTFLSVQRYERTYLFRTDPVELRRSLGILGIEEWVPADSLLAPAPSPDRIGALRVRIPTGRGGTLGADLDIVPDTVGSAVILRSIQWGAPPAHHDSIYMIEFFEQCFVQRVDSLLTGGRSMRPDAVHYPEGASRRYDWCAPR